MYGTVARMRVKAGAEEHFMGLMRQYAQLKINGYLGTFVYRMDSDPREVWLAVVFASREAYDANAESPDQDARFRDMMADLEGEPEWHDGEVMGDARLAPM
ncbi:MAG TPA: antibiotic biosynthesis monooxygenase family protein [Ktedonobacterales bacterium]